MYEISLAEVDINVVVVRIKINSPSLIGRITNRTWAAKDRSSLPRESGDQIQREFRAVLEHGPHLASEESSF